MARDYKDILLVTIKRSEQHVEILDSQSHTIHNLNKFRRGLNIGRAETDLNA